MGSVPSGHSGLRKLYHSVVVPPRTCVFITASAQHTSFLLIFQWAELVTRLNIIKEGLEIQGNK